ncbi:MAG: hypothetical protein MMC33_003126 [Icmadophila ericetorum]|nr:hypothetical protein [Icmadophila ericetorum]
MPTFMDYFENFLGRLFFNYKGRDAKLFTKTAAFESLKPTIEVTSPECGPSTSTLSNHHIQPSIGGQNRFPRLKWSVPADSLTHGIFYGIPPTKTELEPEDFEKEGEPNKLKGGFKYGAVRGGRIYGGPRPPLGHGPHRYFYVVVALKEPLEAGALRKVATLEELEKDVVGKVAAWGEWIGIFERKWPVK